jgi:DNA helicase II / ATP-dependent DNA helicase PcrA
MENRKRDNEPVIGENTHNDEVAKMLSELDSILIDFKPSFAHAFNTSAEDMLSFDVDDEYEEPEWDESILKKWEDLQQITKDLDKRLLIEEDLDEIPSSGKIEYKGNLNPAQLAAVTYTDNPLLVIAGAGSGKTRVITYKVAWLIEKGIPAERILLLTFTKKAAKEMLDRVSGLLRDKTGNDVRGGTFHSFANYVLRKYHVLAGLPPNFTILDPEDVADVIDLLKTELKIKGKKGSFPFPKKKKIQDLFSKCINLQISLIDLIEQDFEECSPYAVELDALRVALGRYKQVANVLDYDDLLVYFKDALQTKPLFKAALLKTFDYILVDEYQDTNGIQRDIVASLASGKSHLTVVGDDAQSIYAFRGANYENILRFPQSFPNCKVIKIEQNYRSDQSVLDFTNAVIQSAKVGFKKSLKSELNDGIKPLVRRFADESEEAEFIVDIIAEGAESGLQFNRFAVLCRSLWQSNFIQIECTKRNIPFVVVGGIKFSERRHVKDVIAFIKLVVNQMDAVAWHRLLQLMDGIGNVRAKEIISHIHSMEGKPDFKEFSTKKYFDSLKQFSELLDYCREKERAPGEVCRVFYQFYLPILQQLEDDFSKRALDLDVFLTIADKQTNLESFLHEFTLDPPSNQYQDKLIGDPSEQKDAVVISTIHSAKGLEWHSVFIPFALDGCLPDNRACSNWEALEEERRLFYVACSRAMKKLFITMPAYVTSWDRTFTLKSRFIDEIDPSLFSEIRT